MAIPGSPNWSGLTDVKAYPSFEAAKPQPLTSAIQSVTIGPNALNQSNGKITQRYWIASQENGQVVIRGANI